MCQYVNARFQQSLQQELPDTLYMLVQKKRGIQYHIPNIQWILKTKGELQKVAYFYFTDYMTAFDHTHHNKSIMYNKLNVHADLSCWIRKKRKWS